MIEKPISTIGALSLLQKQTGYCKTIHRQNMKKVILILLLFTVSETVFAQDDKSFEDKKLTSQRQKEALLLTSFREASLNADELSSAVAIVESSAKKKALIKKDNLLSQEIAAAKIKELSLEMKTELKVFLGSERYDKWVLIRKKQTENKP